MFDAGTGIRELGLELEQQGVNKLHLLLSHYHMDHLQGFPFFTPSYHPGTQIDIHLKSLGSGHALSEPFDKLMEAPHFPISFQELGADIRFHDLEKNGGRFGDAIFTSHPVNHPGGCTAFRLEYKGKTLVYLTDHEPYEGVEDEAVLEFTRGADLLIREAQYTSAEYEQRRGWGHSSFDAAASDARAAGIPSLALYHHEPQHDDEFLERQLGELKSRYSSSALDIFLAREGQCIDLA